MTPGLFFLQEIEVFGRSPDYFVVSFGIMEGGEYIVSQYSAGVDVPLPLGFGVHFGIDGEHGVHFQLVFALKKVGNRQVLVGIQFLLALRNGNQLPQRILVGRIVALRHNK